MIRPSSPSLLIPIKCASVHFIALESLKPGELKMKAIKIFISHCLQDFLYFIAYVTCFLLLVCVVSGNEIVDCYGQFMVVWECTFKL